MLAAHPMRERPRADHDAFTLRPSARVDALLAGHRAIGDMYYGDRPRRTIAEACAYIRGWIAVNLGPGAWGSRRRSPELRYFQQHDLRDGTVYGTLGVLGVRPARISGGSSDVSTTTDRRSGDAANCAATRRITMPEPDADRDAQPEAARHHATHHATVLYAENPAPEPHEMTAQGDRLARLSAESGALW